jgi:hypothetical protein
VKQKLANCLPRSPLPFSCPRASCCKTSKLLAQVPPSPFVYVRQLYSKRMYGKRSTEKSIYPSVCMYPSISLTINLSHEKQGANSTATGLETEVKNIKTKFEEAKTLAEGIAKGSSQDGEESKRIARESHVLASSLQTTMQDLLQDMAEITKTCAAFEQAQRLNEQKACAPAACSEAAPVPAVAAGAEYMEEQAHTEPKKRRRKTLLPEASDSKSDPAVPAEATSLADQRGLFLDGTEEMKKISYLQKQIEQISRVLNLPVSAFNEEDK